MRPWNGMRLAVWAVGAACAASAASACGRPSAVDDVRARTKTEYDKRTGRLSRLSYDADGDGKVDYIGHMDGALVRAVEVDGDKDGRTERWEYYDADQRLQRIGLAVHHDGRQSRVEYLQNGVVTRAEEDTDQDGRVDKWETFEGTRLTSIALDTLRRGTPDRRITYDATGGVVVEMDPTGSGRWSPSE